MLTVNFVKSLISQIGGHFSLKLSFSAKSSILPSLKYIHHGCQEGINLLTSSDLKIHNLTLLTICL